MRRYSCRGFLPDPVPDETIAKITESSNDSLSVDDLRSQRNRPRSLFPKDIAFASTRAQ